MSEHVAAMEEALRLLKTAEKDLMDAVLSANSARSFIANHTTSLEDYINEAIGIKAIQEAIAKYQRVIDSDEARPIWRFKKDLKEERDSVILAFDKAHGNVGQFDHVYGYEFLYFAKEELIKMGGKP